MGRMRRAAVAAVGALALLSPAACGGADSEADQKDVEVFTWWADGGEKAGLDGLVATFDEQCDYSFVNGAVAGGAGSNAKQVLASRLQQGDAPDTFQAHAGAELSDYIAAGQVEDLSALYEEWGLTEALPSGLIDNLSVDGKIYSVPANIHRANVLWTNKSVLSDAGVTAEPTTMADFLAALETLKAKGVSAPLAIGKDWSQLMLLEAVLISDLGPEGFNGLWNGGTDWNSPDVAKGLENYKQLLSYTNADRDTYDWTDAGKLLMDGKAGFFLMGDWAPSDFEAKGFADFGHVAFPGNGDTFQWLADSFVLPQGAKNPEGTKCWLKTVGSAEGQQAFNIKKGSIPARTDVTATDYPAYQQSAIEAWKTATQVPSCAHGAACSQGAVEAANSAIGKFSSDQDAAGLQKALAAAAALGRN